MKNNDTLKNKTSKIKGNLKKYLARIKRSLNTNVWTSGIEEFIGLTLEEGDNTAQRRKKVTDHIELIKSKYKADSDLVKSVIKDNEKFLKEFEEYSNNPHVREIHSMYREVTELHHKRIDSYLKYSNTQAMKLGKEAEDIFLRFDAELQLDLTELRDKARKLDVGDEDPTAHIEFRSGAVCPLIMHKYVTRRYPEIQEKLDLMEIDFESKPENKMLIEYKEDEIPFWDSTRHYWNQSKEALQFYVDEFKKIQYGIEIDGIYIEPWLYTHINVSKYNIPSERANPVTGEKEIITEMIHPYLRDNEWWVIQDNYSKASKRGVNKKMAIVATRRAGKTTMLISKYLTSIYQGKVQNVLAGSSSQDLGQITRGLLTMVPELHPAFAIPMDGKTDTNSLIQIVIKTKSQSNIGEQFISIVNTEAGAKTSSEKLAGYSMDEFNWDEFMKAPYLQALQGAEPAYKSSLGYRTTPILSGTGGSEEMSQDALLMLNNLEENEVFEMDWDLFESRIPEEEITWNRRDFSTFIPAQMAEETNVVKDDSNLADYLGIESERLGKIPIKVTNWKKANQHFNYEERKRSNDEGNLRRYKVYFPRDPSDIFLSGNSNPYPADVIRELRLELEKNPKGEKVVLSRTEDGEINIIKSNKAYIKFPFAGGTHDAPATIYEMPVENPPEDFYTAGLDDVQQDKSSTDSVRAFVIWRRDTKKIVASLYTRPSDPKIAHEQMHMLLDLYNSQLFLENVNMDIKSYFDTIDEYAAERYLVRAINFLGNIQLEGSANRSFGYAPLPNNIAYLHSITYKTLTGDVIVDTENGVPVTRKVYATQHDTRALLELENYSPNRNLDGYDALRGAIALDHYLTFNNINPQYVTRQELEEKRAELQRRRLYRESRPNIGNFSKGSSKGQFSRKRKPRRSNF